MNAMDAEVTHLRILANLKTREIVPQFSNSPPTGYDIPASEIEAGMELHLPCLVKVGQGNNGYKTIGEFLPEAAE